LRLSSLASHSRYRISSANPVVDVAIRLLPAVHEASAFDVFGVAAVELSSGIVDSKMASDSAVVSAHCCPLRGVGGDQHPGCICVKFERLQHLTVSPLVS